MANEAVAAPATRTHHGRGPFGGTRDDHVSLAGSSRAATRVSARARTRFASSSARRCDAVRRIRNRGFRQARAGATRSDVSARGLATRPSTMRFRASIGSLRVANPRLPCGPSPRRRARGGGGARGARQSREKNISWTRPGRRSTPGGGPRRRARRSRACPPSASCTWRASSRSARVRGRTAPGDSGGESPRGRRREALSGDASDAENVSARGVSARDASASCGVGVAGALGDAGDACVDVALAAPVLVLPRGTHDFSRSVEIHMGALEAKNAFENNLDVLEVRLTGVDVAIAPRADGAEPRAPGAARLASRRRDGDRLQARRILKNDAAARPSNGDAGGTRSFACGSRPRAWSCSSADFKRIAGSSRRTPKSARRGSRLRRTRRGVARVPRRMETGQGGPGIGSGRTLHDRVGRLPRPRARARSTEARANCSGSADDQPKRASGARRCSSRRNLRAFFLRRRTRRTRGVPGRGPPRAACARVAPRLRRRRRADVGGDVLADVSLAAFALEDLRGGKRHAVAGGGAMAEHEPLGGGGTNIQKKSPSLLRAHCAAGAETTHAAATMQRFALEVDPPFLLDVARVFVASALAVWRRRVPRGRPGSCRSGARRDSPLRPGTPSCARRGASSPTAHAGADDEPTAAAAPSSSTAAVTPRVRTPSAP